MRPFLLIILFFAAMLVVSACAKSTPQPHLQPSPVRTHGNASAPPLPQRNNTYVMITASASLQKEMSIPFGSLLVIRSQVDTNITSPEMQFSKAIGPKIGPVSNTSARLNFPRAGTFTVQCSGCVAQNNRMVVTVTP